MQFGSRCIRKWTSLLVAAAMVVGMVPGVALAAPVPVGDPGTYAVGNFADLQTALADPTMSTITLTADISSTAQLHVMRGVTIDGAGHSITVSTNLGTVNGSKHAISFEASQSPVLIKNITIDSAALAYGLSVYGNAIVSLENVTAKNSRGAGLTVNGSSVMATALSTSGNAWGAVNVDPGSGVSTPSSFTLISGTLAESNKIWSDGSHVTPSATVTVVAPASYVSAVVNGMSVWAPPVTVSATAGSHGSVSPAAQSVDPGSASTTIAITPEAGYYCSELLIDGVAKAPALGYRFANVGLVGHTLKASFAPLSPLETFDFAPLLSSTQASGKWFTDRYAPAGFAKSSFGGDVRLKLSISSADSQANRPSNYSGAFYNTQGRNYDLAALSDFVTTDLYIGSDWDTQDRRADLWANAVDAGGQIVGYPILGFLKGTGFRVWDNLGWHNVGYPEGFQYGAWYNLRIQRTANSLTYYVNDQLLYTTSFADDTDVATTVGFNNLKLQAYNFGESYDVYFDNAGPIVPTPAPYKVSTAAGTHGSISPSNPGADAGEDIVVSITPDAGYHIADVVVDGQSIGTSSSVEFKNVVTNHAVSASFAINSYTLTASAGLGGFVSPAGVATKIFGSTATYAFTPYPGYHVADVLVDGVSVGSPSEYIFSDIVAAHTLAVSFARNTYTITSSAGANGHASWTGARTVVEGSNATIVFTPAYGYVVSDVVVDGVSQGGVGSYAFTDISSNHEVSVTFAKRTFTLTAGHGLHGAISPDAMKVVVIGGSTTFRFTPALGYHIANVYVDGGAVGVVSSYTFRNVQANHTISVTFAANPKVSSLSRPYAPTYASKGIAFNAFGYLKPKHAAGTYPVRIYKWQKVAGKWVARGYVSAKASNYGTYTKFATKLSLGAKGSWKLRAFAPADRAHAATWSLASDYLTVR